MTPQRGPLLRQILRTARARDTFNLATATLQAFNDREFIPDGVRLTVSYRDDTVSIEAHTTPGNYDRPVGVFHLHNHDELPDGDEVVRRAAKIIETFYQAAAVGLFRAGAREIYVLNAAPAPIGPGR